MGTWQSCIAMGNKKVDYSNWPIYILIKRFLSILSKMAGAVPLSPEAIEERAQVRSKLKAYFLKNIHDPFRHGSAQGEFLFEPGLMRYNAMLVTKYDHFKATPKTTLIGTMLILIPFGVYGYILKTRKQNFHHQCRTGQIAYKDRINFL